MGPNPTLTSTDTLHTKLLRWYYVGDRSAPERRGRRKRGGTYISALGVARSALIAHTSTRQDTYQLGPPRGVPGNMHCAGLGLRLGPGSEAISFL